jgi:hypothetical protein
MHGVACWTHLQRRSRAELLESTRTRCLAGIYQRRRDTELV